MNDHHIKQSPMLTLPSLGGGSHSPLVHAAGGGNLDSDLLMHWDFGDNNCWNQGTTITDLTGNGYNGFFKSAQLQYVTDMGDYYSSGGTAAFYGGTEANNGQYDLMNLIGSQNFTMEFWNNPTAYGGEYLLRYEWSSGGPTTYHTAYITYMPNSSNPGLTHIGFADDAMYKPSWTNWVDLDTTDPGYGGPTSGWEHIVLSREGTGTNEMKFYRNGSLFAQKTNSIVYTAGGSDPYPNGQGGSNAIFQVGGYKAVFKFHIGKGFTSDEVTTRFNAEKSRFGL